MFLRLVTGKKIKMMCYPGTRGKYPGLRSKQSSLVSSACLCCLRAQKGVRKLLKPVRLKWLLLRGERTDRVHKASRFCALNSWGAFWLTAMVGPFQFVEIEDSWVSSATANEEDWMHCGSKARWLPLLVADGVHESPIRSCRKTRHLLQDLRT